MFDAAFDQLREASIDKGALLRRFAINIARLAARAPAHNRGSVVQHAIKLRGAIARGALDETARADLERMLDEAAAAGADAE